MRTGRTSIARRLALLHIVAVLISYTVFGAVFYVKRIEHRQNAEARELTYEAISLQTMMRQPNGRQMLEYEIRAQRYEPESIRMFIRLLDPRGQALLETPGMDRVIPVSAFSSPRKEPGECTYNWRNGNGDHFLLKSVPLPDGMFCGPGCSLQLASDVNDQAAYGRELLWTLVAFVFCGLLFAFVCAYFIVRFGLKPLEEISRTASSITGRDLHTRIDETTLPEELVSLGHSFNAMLARLEHSFDRLSDYSANLAHEMRTPINTLTIAADIALSREREPEEYRAVLASSLDELGRMSVTIDRMLFLARADVEQPDLTLQHLDVASEVDNLFDYYSEAAMDAQVTLQSSGSATVYADEALFRRTLTNLISNSLAHTPAGGVIKVSFCSLPGQGVEVAVRDSGCGIEQEHLPKVLDRFYRIPGSKSPDGTGLGLAIVRAIMQMHGGSLAIESEPGSGTAVKLTFPIGPAPWHNGEPKTSFRLTHQKSLPVPTRHLAKIVLSNRVFTLISLLMLHYLLHWDIAHPQRNSVA